MQIVFFKRPRPRQFDYKPRYYDEEKELREERRKTFEAAEKGDVSSTTLKRNIDVRWRKADRRNRQRSKGVNVLVYLVIIALMVYFMFFV